MGASGAPQSRKRILRDLLIGACLGGIGAVLVWVFYPGFWKEPPVAAQEIALRHRQALHEEAQRQAAARAALAAAVRPVAEPAACDLEPLIPPNGAKDGRASVEHPFPGGPRAKAKVFLRAAEAAAAQGRLRDAEVALLAACRQNDEASTRPTVPLARVLGMLGERYAAAAADEDSPTLREQLHARARQVLVLSAQAYATALGPNASRSRQARQRLATLEQDFLAPMDAPPRVLARPKDELASARPARAERVRPATPRPPPKPAQNQSGREADPEVTRLASDLARLRAQAEAVSDDPAGFRQRAEAARAQRDRCQDAACLRDWYAKRRQELLAEF